MLQTVLDIYEWKLTYPPPSEKLESGPRRHCYQAEVQNTPKPTVSNTN